MKIKKITYPTPLETILNIYNDNIDVFVEMEDGTKYTLTVCTPQFYVSYMKKENLEFVPAGCPDVIVSVLTDEIIKKALQTYCKYDGYWIKLYYLAGMNEDIFSMENMNQMIENMNHD
ncbi:MAG: hypothetical protein K2M46_09590 [Lachnospiraceae bacterium]|nr:hypothetical protein [Lachnospiraceae bacterium]